MSFFSAIFGKPKTAEPAQAPRPTAHTARPAQGYTGDASPKTALQNNAQTIEALKKKEEMLEAEIAQLKSEAKQKLDKGDKTGALRLMKRAKDKEKKLATVDGGIAKIEQISDALETSVLTKTLVGAVKAGTKALEASKTDVDAADEAMNELEDQLQNVQEAQDMLLRPEMESADESELLAELELMEGPKATTAAQGVPVSAGRAGQSNISLPSAPTGDIKPAKQQYSNEEEEMLAQLRGQMS